MTAAFNPARSTAMLLARADRCQQSGAYDEAIALYQAVLRADPRLAEAHNNLGAAFAARGRHHEAVSCYRRALRLRPGDTVGHANLGRVLIDIGRHREGIEHLAEAYLADPGDPAHRGRLLSAISAPAKETTAGAPFGARARRAMARLAADPEVDSLRLVKPAAAMVNSQGAVVRALRRLDARGRLVASDVGGQLYAALAEPLFATVLAAHVVNDHHLEALLTALRRLWLKGVAGEGPAAPLPPAGMLASLALQMQITEWAYAVSEEEESWLETLGEDLSRPGRRMEGDAPARRLLVWALYRPLRPVADDPGLRRLARRGGGPLGELLYRHLVEPEIEAKLAADLPRLTPIEDAVSQKVRAQYEESPYPRWRRLAARHPAPVGEVLAAALDDPRLARAIDITQPRILVAGCGTGQHAVATARRFAGAEVLAVDLSRNALAFAARQAAELGVDSVTFAQADILGLESLTERFDIVECSGVLHHMADPAAGWRVLRGLLAPLGLMRISLYSERGRAGVDQARRLIAERGLSATPAGIRAARAVVRTLAAEEPARVMADSADFFSLSGCRDMFFHVQEMRYTLPRIARELAALDLDFLGFELPDARIRRLYRHRFPLDGAARSLGNWDRLEREIPDLFAAMYQFWCRAQP